MGIEIKGGLCYYKFEFGGFNRPLYLIPLVLVTSGEFFIFFLNQHHKHICGYFF